MTETQTSAAVTPRLKTRYREEILPALQSEFDIKNVMSLLIFTQVIAVIPGEMLAIYRTKSAFVFLLVLATGVAIIAFVAFMKERYYRRFKGRVQIYVFHE